MDAELSLRKFLGLDKRTSADGKPGQGGKPTPRVVAATGPRRCKLPPGTLLSKLPTTHQALDWLRGQGFDPKVIFDRWGPYYADHNAAVDPLFTDARVVVPIHSIELGPIGEKVACLAGWEAMSIAGKDRWMGRASEPVCSKDVGKGSLLYGLHHAMGTRGPVVVVQKITDAWRVGSSVVAFRLQRISHIQTYLLVRNLRNRPLVVLLDSEWDSAKVADTIRSFRQRECDPAPVVEAHLPGNCATLAGCTTEQARQAVRTALKGMAAGGKGSDC
ncbi:MAG: hypothetical protein NTY19_07185 [Planctomycetota bacterium]|nr:hypothetical protein [Planctomycetota bacterium]